VKKKLLVLALISTTVYGAWHLRSDSSPPQASQASLVLDRIWIDHMPRNDKDMFHAFVAITEQPFGVFQETSQWKGNFELFNYEANGDELRIVYPQSGDRDKVTATANPCSEKGMDFCLELKGARRGVKRYYSMKGWEIDHAARPEDVRARIDALASTAP